jgi:threonine dehydratase
LIVLGLLVSTVQRSSKTLDARLRIQPAPELGPNTIPPSDHPFVTSAVATLVAERVREIHSLIPLEKTVHFAATRGCLTGLLALVIDTPYAIINILGVVRETSTVQGDDGL